MIKKDISKNQGKPFIVLTNIGKSFSHVKIVLVVFDFFFFFSSRSHLRKQKKIKAIKIKSMFKVQNMASSKANIIIGNLENILVFNQAAEVQKII